MKGHLINKLKNKMNAYLEDNKERFLSELLQLLRIPSISAKAENKDDMVHCAK